jgi:hypothetical protein
MHHRVTHSCALFALHAALLTAQSLEFTQLPRERVIERLERLPAENAARRMALRDLFQQAGCPVESLTEQPVKGSKEPNVLCRLPGTTDTTVVLGAHFDRASKGTGAIDDWTGTALLPSLLESLHSKPRRLTFLFVGFTDEEKGLVGSRHFVKQLSKEEKRRIRAYINLECFGLAGTKIWMNRSDRELTERLLRIGGALKLPLGGVDVDQVGDTDSHAFKDAKIPVLDLHSITQETFPLLHTENDTLPAINRDEYYNTYRLLSAFLAYLDLTWATEPAR